MLVAFRGLLVYRLPGGRCSDVLQLMSVPADSDGIIPDWLTVALREAGAISHTRVTSIQSGPVGHMGMTHSFVDCGSGMTGRNRARLGHCWPSSPLSTRKCAQPSTQ